MQSITGHYETEEVAFGVVYKWCPECVVIECDCGERQTFTGLRTVCGRCGTDHAYTIRQELAALRVEYKDERPWRYRGIAKKLLYLSEKSLELSVVALSATTGPGPYSLGLRPLY